MTLRRQLLVASLLLLTLPWAGCQFIREMEGALRQGQEQSLQATSTAVAAVLKNKPRLLYPYPQRVNEPGGDNSGYNRSLYASPVEQTIIIDGYDDGWEELDFQHFEHSSADSTLSLDYKAAMREGRLYLFLQVQDDDVVFHNPALSPEPNGDRLILRTWMDGRRQEYVIATAAPGKVTARYGNRIYASGSASRIRGQWQDTALGYNLELQIPLSITGGRLGFYIVNAKSKAGSAVETLGNDTALDMAPPPWLIYSPDTLQRATAPFIQDDRQLQIVDKGGWLLLNTPPASSLATEKLSSNQAEETFWLLRAIYRSILSHDEPQASAPVTHAGKLAGKNVDSAIAGIANNTWHRDPDDPGRSLLSSVSPILDGKDVIGAVLVSQSSEQYLSLTDRAFSRLLGYSLLALCVGVFGLLGYASILSWRIRKLSLAASAVIREDGSMGDDFPRSKANDEIGELSRHYGDMLDKLREYNDYLRTLSRKLSHELRTPIAIIQTSLENLEHKPQENASNTVYIERARLGLARLNKILSAMSEANRLEESIHNNEPVVIAIAPLLQEIFPAYEQLYTHCSLRLETPPEELHISGVSELIVQAIDKLMDNAASFCPEDGSVVLALTALGDRLELSVANDGPLLPEELNKELFDSMVSLREGSSDNVHLGLGLYIVRLIAEFHGGRVHAENRGDKTGVKFGITIPCSTAGVTSSS